MQIHRIDRETQLPVDPHGATRPSGAPTGIPAAGDDNSRSRTEVHDSGNPELDRLSDSLQSVPEVRTDVVETARQKVVQGDYLTRSAAEELAGSELRDEFYS